MAGRAVPTSPVTRAASPRLTAIIPATDRPATLPSCLEAIRAADRPPEELVVVRDPAAAGPAAARNAGARRARGELLVFIDSDVKVHTDAFARIRDRFDADPTLTAVFGSYDDSPAADDGVSSFRNLLHHHVHHESPGPVTTFWAGLGAVERASFLAAGGFDSDRFPSASIEDIELGLRLTDRGARIELDPGVLGTHLKRWRLSQMVRSDLLDRGVPWLLLLLRSGRRSSALNLGWRHRASAAVAMVAVAAAIRRRLDTTGGALIALLALNRSFYALLWRRRGPVGASAGLGLHVLHHVTAAAAVPCALAVYARERCGVLRSHSRSGRRDQAGRVAEDRHRPQPT
jgi:Glycosyl transferase family 2